jgi:hypothetical protein
MNILFALYYFKLLIINYLMHFNKKIRFFALTLHARQILPEPILIMACFFSFSMGYSQYKLPEKNDRQPGMVVKINNPAHRTITEIDLPDSFQSLSETKKTTLLFYALPNGNSIEWTRGKKMKEGDDWHFGIQHIAAQTNWLRNALPEEQLIVIYLSNELKSWPAWKRLPENGPAEIKRMVDSISGIFAAFKPQIMLNSHSGGGSFIFGYLDAVKEIPDNITRIGFIDSDYGYEDSLHGDKIAHWLKSAKNHFLTVLAYNDSVVIYNGKPLVSATGGTWYRSKMLLAYLQKSFPAESRSDTSLLRCHFLSNRVNIILKTNIEGKIYHTEQVARNGFIHTVIQGTKLQKKTGDIYWKDPVYTGFIE